MLRPKRYLKVWYLLTVSAVMADLTHLGSVVLFLFGKVVRIAVFAIFLLLLFSGKRSLAGYSLPQALIFYLTFNLIDTITQIFLRGAYFFRRLVIAGNLDFILVRPLSPLFLVLFSHTDVIDFVVFWPIFFLLARSLSHLPGLNPGNLIFYVLLVFSGLLVAASFHILVISLAITTYEVDNALMIYRDLSSLGRVPIDLYREPLRFVFTFVLPIGIMMTFPVKALLGLLSPPVAILSVFISLVFFAFSLRVWHGSLSLYASASS